MSNVMDNHPVEVTEKIYIKNDVVILQPITMRFPNCHGVHSLSKLKTQKEVSYKEFLTRYADRPRKIRICFDEIPSPDTLLQQSEFITAYGYELDCWYIVTSNGNGDGPTGM
jgi:hypothetical protein